MTQPRAISLLEAVIGTAFGFAVALGLQVFVFPVYGIETDLNTNLQIAAIFTVASIIRGYLVQRLFNWVFR